MGRQADVGDTRCLFLPSFHPPFPIWRLGLLALCGLVRLLMAGSCPLTKISTGQHDVFFHMEKGDTPAEGRRDLTWLLESKRWSGTAPFSS